MTKVSKKRQVRRAIEPQRARVRGGDRRGARHGRRAARPLRDDRRQHPQDQEWSGDQPGPVPGVRDDDRGRGGERDAAGHPPVEAAEIERQAELRLRGGDPLEQAAGGVTNRRKSVRAMASVISHA